MPMIHVPESADSLLQFVKGSSNERREHSFFPTYAHLVTSAAGLGAAQGLFTSNPATKEQDPRPIEFAVFQNQGLHYALMAYAIGHTRDPAVCNDPDRLCRVIEGLADAGFLVMSERLIQCGAVYWMQEWEGMLLELLQ